MVKKRKTPIKIKFGDMPIETINATLGMELDEGPVEMSGNAQIHAARRHPKDYARCIGHISAIINGPLYIGDDFKNPNKIELISRVKAVDSAILVAVSVEPDANGVYHVTSFYPISEKKLANRLNTGFLKFAK